MDANKQSLLTSARLALEEALNTIQVVQDAPHKASPDQLPRIQRATSDVAAAFQDLTWLGTILQIEQRTREQEP